MSGIEPKADLFPIKRYFPIVLMIQLLKHLEKIPEEGAFLAFVKPLAKDRRAGVILPDDIKCTGHVPMCDLEGRFVQVHFYFPRPK
jgi:hypothetical protein